MRQDYRPMVTFAFLTGAFLMMALCLWLVPGQLYLGRLLLLAVCLGAAALFGAVTYKAHNRHESDDECAFWRNETLERRCESHEREIAARTEHQERLRRSLTDAEYRLKNQADAIEQMQKEARAREQHCEALKNRADSLAREVQMESDAYQRANEANVEAGQEIDRLRNENGELTLKLASHERPCHAINSPDQIESEAVWLDLARAINHLSWAVHQTNLDNGWWAEGPVAGKIPQALCLVHSEVSEALECYRNPDKALSFIWTDEKGKPEGFAVELADVVIRVLDMARAYDLPFVEAMRAKMAYNRTRSHRHGGKKC